MNLYCANPSAQFNRHQNEIEVAVQKVLRGNRYILGEEVEAFESEFAQFIGVRYAIGVANGTDALEIAMRALGIGVGDEVITVSHTAVATVASIEATGATAVLVDVDSGLYTLNPSLLEGARSSKSRAVIAVHLYGQAADLEAIGGFCKRNGLFLIEDVSQAHGARWMDRRLGSIGDIACFSCYPTKNLGAIGDAGIIVTNDHDLGVRAKMIREYGWRDRYISEIVGRNSRLDEVQAAILRIKLRHLDEDNNKRQELAGRYLASLQGINIQLPVASKFGDHIYHLFVICTSRRDELLRYLVSRHIYAGIHYPVPVHLQPAYKNRVITKSKMDVTEKLSLEVVSLPLYPEIGIQSIERVSKVLLEFFSENNDC